MTNQELIARLEGGETGREMDGPLTIWLGPSCDPERTWCQDNVYERCECGKHPVQYVRLDAVAALLKAEG